MAKVLREEKIAPRVTAQWLEMPRGEQESLVITFRRFRNPFTVVACLLTAYMFLRFSLRVDHPERDGVASWSVSLALFALGIALAWVGGLALLNSTRVVMRDQALIIIRSPIPWPPKRVIPLTSVDIARALTFSGEEGPTFALEIVTDQAAHRVISGLEAHHLAQRAATLINLWIGQARAGTESQTSGIA